MGPLDAVWQWYEYARDSIDLTSSRVREAPESIPASLVFARQASPPEALEHLAKAETELCDLTVLALFAVFEQALLDHLRLTSNLVERGAASPLQACLASRAFKELDRWPLGEILDVYKVVVAPSLVGLVKQVKDYRDWVAHGKRGVPDARLDPSAAHERLASFLGGLP